MKEQLSSMVRFCVIAGLSIAVFGGGAEAARQRPRMEESMAAMPAPRRRTPGTGPDIGAASVLTSHIAT